MSSTTEPPRRQTIQFSRFMRPDWVIAVGLGVSIGLAIFTLLGQFTIAAGRQTLGMPFLLFGLAALPMVLTYAERAAVTPSNNGAYAIAQTSGLVGLIYSTGWLLLGGYSCLIALLGWGAALHFNLLTERYFDLSLDLALLTVVITGLVAIGNLVGTTGSWRSRSTYIYLGLIVISYIIIQDLIEPASPEQWVLLQRNTPQIFSVATLIITSLWGLFFILNFRNETPRPTQTIPRAMLLTLGGVTLAGLLAGLALADYGGLPQTLTPLIEILGEITLLSPDLTFLLYAGFGLLINFIALNQGLVVTLGLIEQMAEDGFLPERLKQLLENHNLHRLPLVLLVIFSMALIVSLEVLTLVGLAALAFLLITALVHLPDAVRSQPRLPEKRSPKLPFHPLFPWLTVAIAGLMLISLAGPVWWSGSVWGAIGLVYYLLYARRGGLAVRRQEIMVGQPAAVETPVKADYVIMAAVTDSTAASSLLQAAGKVARARQGKLLALKVLVMAEQISPHLKQKTAQKEWEALDSLVQQANTSGIEATPLVRLAPSFKAGILESIREEDVGLLLLSWNPESTSAQNSDVYLLDQIFRWAPCDVAVLHRTFPECIERALVPTAGGPHAPSALALARDLAEQTGPELLVEHMVTDPMTSDREAAANSNLQATVSALRNGRPFKQRVVEVGSVKAGILAEAKQADILLLGASNQGVLERTFFGGLPIEVATSTLTPTIIVKGHQPDRRTWPQYFGEILSDALPALTVERQSEVFEQMRSSAEPTVDFFVLITLAAMIASLGLLQNSAAVIIGAMLVAPLMSPILAMAMGIVRGNLFLLRTAAEATTKGIVLAIFLGVAMTTLSPITNPTQEILARTAPNLLDLLVALASGAAAGYAIGRKEVAAALPGVAIAAALVPPLCVVGFGLGTSDLNIASGSLLLFITNLIAIVFAAAVIFLALGFQPPRTERGELLRGLKVTLVSLGAVFLILSFATAATVVQINRQARIEQILRSEVVLRGGLIDELAITEVEDGFIITGVIVDIIGNKLTPREIAQIQDDLEEAVGGSVSVQAVVIPGQYQNFDTYDQRLRLESLFVSRIEERAAQVDRVAVSQADTGFVIEAGIIAFDSEQLNQTALTEIQEELSEIIEAPVTIRTTIVPATQLDAEAPTPTPTPEP